jgi:hypothetical protein
MPAASETLWRIYNGVNDLIKFSDSKAGVILAVNGIIVSAILSNLDEVGNILSTNPIIYNESIR